MGSGRSKFRSNVQWMNTACDEYDDECAAIFRGRGLKVTLGNAGAPGSAHGTGASPQLNTCRSTRALVQATRLGANIVASASRATGMERYDAMLELRRGIAVRGRGVVMCNHCENIGQK